MGFLHACVLAVAAIRGLRHDDIQSAAAARGGARVFRVRVSLDGVECTRDHEAFDELLEPAPATPLHQDFMDGANIRHHGSSDSAVRAEGNSFECWP